MSFDDTNRYELDREFLQERPKAPDEKELARWDTAALNKWLSSHRAWEKKVQATAKTISEYEEEEND
jgi:hypothetical protein